MKKQFFFALVLMLSVCLLSTTCSDDDDGGMNDNSQQIEQIKSNMQMGTWRVTNFNDSGQNETSDFTGYNFTFNADGSLSASNGSNTVNGTWSVTDDSNSTDNSNSNSDIDFNMFFAVEEDHPFEDLNDDWDILSSTETKIELRDISGGNGGTDLLTLEKN